MVGHLSYMLLVLSMIMRTMTKLRIIAVSAGVTSMAYGLFWLNDPVTVFWEFVFVSVNLIQLLILTYENRSAKHSEEEAVIVNTMVKGLDRRHARTVLRLGTWKEADPGSILIEEGQMVPNLMLLTRGAVQVERDGRIIGVCGEGDFLGEISFLNGVGATANVTVANQVRYFAFERQRLKSALERDPELRTAVEASINRNLAAKLVKTSHAVMEKMHALKSVDRGLPPPDTEADGSSAPKQASG